MFVGRLSVCCALSFAALTPTFAADPEPSSSGVEETIQVTATRLPEDIHDLPAAITVVSGAELEARGVSDLAGALALVGGASIAPGGDGGPASSVPELMGLREFDAFLLVVDGVPWGGAFNPALSTLDLTNVERIEVLRGAAPVLYGATSFVGVIHVVHREPKNTPRTLGASGGRFGSWGGAVTSAIPGGAKFAHAVSASYDDRGFSDDRTSFDRAHLLWSAAAEPGRGSLHLFADVTEVNQDPASPHPREGQELSSLVPLDANHNPTDARIDERRYHLAGSYDLPAGPGTWGLTLAATHSTRDTVRGFLREMFDVPPGTANADGYRQDFSGDDFYLDTRWSWRHGSELSLVAGVDALAGKGRAESENFEYHVAPDGTGAPASDTVTIDERPEFEDERTFFGLYGLALWTPSERWTIDAGLRLNNTHEKQEGEVEVNGVDTRVTDKRSDTRVSGSLGASFRAWQGATGALWVYASYTDAFKPAAVDFGPEAEGAVLDPETARTGQIGLKGAHLGGKVFWQLSAYRMDFKNLVVAQTVNGLPALTNAGEERFQGVEVEARWRALDDLDVDASFASHSAKFTDYVAEFGGVPTRLDGNSLELSPDKLASVGLSYHPASGFLAWGGASYVGERWLNKRNTAQADAFTTYFAGLGYRFSRGVEIRVEGTNLSDARDPVSESELGDAQYYRQPARRWRAALVWRL